MSSSETLDQTRPADRRHTLLDADGSTDDVAAPNEHDAPAATIERGSTIGRYLVIEPIGAGAMGVVVRAYDPKLSREVALKRLHRDVLDQRAEARLLREAQAMAQLSHPNVITIHDVERTEAGVVMAMEYVPGLTLAQWLDPQERARRGEPAPTPSEVLERFGQAGEGLWAAHQAGLVHRDFKPGNVMVGPDGRVRVMDFGLARAEARGDDPNDIDDEEVATSDVGASTRPSRPGAAALASASGISLDDDHSLSQQLTRVGAVMGTPTYMAPEQHRGEVADARSDQYAFCVSLWEGLYGTRPFEGGSVAALAMVKHRGPPTPPRNAKIPRPVVDALQRGLAPRPDDRWPSMAALLAALRTEPSEARPAWRRTLGPAVVIASLGAVVWLAQRDDGPAPCTDAEAQLVDVWDDARRTAVREAMNATALSYAETTATRVIDRLDAYATAWTRMHTEACEATAIRHVQSPALLDLRMQCLHRRRTQLGAAVDVLAQADSDVAQTAIQQVMELPSIDRCADVEALTAAIAPPDDPEVAREVETLRDALDHAKAQQRAGRYDDARTEMDALLPKAEALDYAPLTAELLSASAILARHQGQHDRAVDEATRAYAIAVREGVDAIAAEAASVVMYVKGSEQAEVAVGEAWATTALAFAQREEPGGIREAQVINGTGVLAYRGGDFAEATRRFERALPMLEKALGPYDDRIAVSLNHLGVMLDEQGRFTEAEPHFRRALGIQTEVFGDRHPRITMSMDNLALCLQAQGRNEEALALHEAALEIRAEALRPDHPDTGLTHNNLGWDYMGLGRLDEAAQQFGRALEIFERSLGAEHPRVAMAAESLATVELRRKRYPQAEALHRRALEIRKTALGADHPNVALSLSGLGTVAGDQERYEEAIALHQRALAIIEAKGEGAERYLADIVAAMGRAQLGAERFADAESSFARALELRGSGGSSPLAVAGLRFELAQARWGLGEDREAARALAQQAREEIAELEGEQVDEARARMDAWLREH